MENGASDQAVCAACGEPQEIAPEALEALRRIHPGRDVICATCAVDRKGAFAPSTPGSPDPVVKPQQKRERIRLETPVAPDPNADEMDWLPKLKQQRDQGPILYDLFCGPGGFSTGFEWAGCKSLLGVDIHEPSLRTFAMAHPSSVAIHSDVREIDGKDLLEKAGGVKPDILTAGIPCEGFSRANRNRQTFIDARNFLFLEFLRIVEQLEPGAVVVENVQALTSHSEGFFKREIVGGIEALGYRCYTKTLDASDYGVPQRRRRVIFVGLAPDAPWAWPRPSHGRDGDFAVRTVRDAFDDLPDIGPNECAEFYDRHPGNAFQAFLRADQSVLLNHIAPKHPPATIARIGGTDPGEPMYPRFKQRIRLHPNRLSPTVVSGGIRPQFAHGHPWQPRGLTIRERARLQSFPDSYSFEGGVVQGRVQTGDAVPPLMAWRLAAQIRDALRGQLSPERSLSGDFAAAMQLSLT